MIYYKVNGNGNNFLALDNRNKKLSTEKLTELAIKDCNCKTSVGADGILAIEESKVADFRMRIFNCDGSEGEMCGNGARCIARFAYDIGAAKEDMCFETLAGVMKAKILGDEVSVDMGNIDLSKVLLDHKIEFGEKSVTYNFVTVGVPHVVLYCEENDIDSEAEMRAIGTCFNCCPEVFEHGSNVNFVKIVDEHNIEVITFERGVNDLTDSCGTGSSASAIITALKKYAVSPVDVKNKGGINKVRFEFANDEGECNIHLQGKVAYAAKIEIIDKNLF